MEFLNTILAMIVTLGILVTIHEYGHFWVARRCGVKVLRFSVGFGKPLFSWRDRQGTEYAVALIPLGGYVSMLDEREGDVPQDQLQYAFNRKPVLQRIAVVAAGPVVNLLFAVLVYWAMFVAGVEKVVPVTGEVVADSIAERAGVLAGDEIVAVAGKPTQSWDEVNLALAGFVGESAAVPMIIKPQQGNLQQTRTLVFQDWRVDLETESPLMALGVVPFSPDYPAVIGRLAEDGQAGLAGIRVGDRVIAVNDIAVVDWLALVNIVKASPGELLRLDIERDARVIQLSVTPAVRVSETGEITGYIGAGVQAVEWPPEMRRTIQYGVVESIGKAFAKTAQMITLTLDSIWKMLEGILSVKNLSGPITIAKVAGASAASGLEAFAGFLAYLSISLGILNLLPIPVLDGGHLLYYCVELVRGKPVSERIQMVGLRLGMAVLFTMMGVAIFNDLMRL